MRRTPDGFAQRCLPMLVANQHGWSLISAHRVTATWDGTEGLDGVHVHVDEELEPWAAQSYFGCGILTWALPFLFRTPPGVDLLLRGPANFPKDGAAPLEGLIETDWTPTTATMNWRLTRPGLPVVFNAGDPIAMVVPVERGEIEAYRGRVIDLADANDDLTRGYDRWRVEREAFLRSLHEARGRRSGWQGDYFRGSVAGTHPKDRKHVTRLHLRGFEDG